MLDYFQFGVIMKKLLEHSGTNFFFFFWWTKTLISLGPQGGGLFSLSRNTGVVKGEHEAAWSASGTVG